MISKRDNLFIVKTELNKKIMKIKNTFRSFCLVALLVPAVFVSCDDDLPEIKDLFRPRLMDSTIIGNNITVAWYDMYDAVSYTLEAAYDQNFTNMLFTEELERSVLKITDLPYGTQVFFRLRANAADAKNSSAWVTFNATTEKRITAMILHSVDKSNILENEVLVTWTVDAENPVDSIGVTPLDALSTSPAVGRYLTEDEIAAGSAVLDGLEKNTVYKLNVYDSSKPGKYDKPYNEVQFRTAGPPAGAINISMSDDLGAILAANDKDSEIPEGTTYYIEPGSSFNMTGVTITKGFRLVAAPGVRPKITLTSNFQLSGNISEFYIEGIDIYNPTSASYFINNGSGGTNFTIGEFSLIDCQFSGCARGFIRTQGVGTKNFGKMLIDNCIMNVVESYSGGGFGFFLLNTETDIVESFTVTNSTFYKTCVLGKGIIEAQKELGSMDITITNCTFYDSFAGTLILTQNLGGGNAVVSNNLFAGSLNEKGETTVSHGGIYRIPSTVSGTASKNYYTPEFILGGYPLPVAPIKLTTPSKELFESPSTGNLTIIDKTSPAYENRVGDPRWLK